MLGYTVNPLVLPPVLFALAAAHFGAPAGEVAYVGVMALVGLGLVPLAYVLHLVRRHRIATIEIVDRRRRVGPLLVGLAASGVTCGLLATTVDTAAAMVSALAALHLVNTALAFTVTLRWKISIHAMALAGFAAVLAFLAWGPLQPPAPLIDAGAATGAAALVPLLMWARVRARVHTPAQVFAGAAAGLILPPLQLLLCYRAGLFAGL